MFKEVLKKEKYIRVKLGTSIMDEHQKRNNWRKKTFIFSYS